MPYQNITTTRAVSVYEYDRIDRTHQVFNVRIFIMAQLLVSGCFEWAVGAILWLKEANAVSEAGDMENI